MKHSLHPFKDKQEEVSNQLLMMTDKRIENDGKVEAKVTIFSQVNDYEVEMTNMVCSDWLNEKTNQQELSNASMALMEEVQCKVRKDD